MRSSAQSKGRRELSPDISLFSSTSASVDRCSFASDSHSLASSDLSNPHCGGGDCGDNSDSNQDASRLNLLRSNRAVFSNVRLRNRHPLTTISDSAVSAPDSRPLKVLDSARNSFSIAVKECQDKRTMNNATEIKHQLYNSVTGRAIPSKWEDAERWVIRQPPQMGLRKPKSKSGPLGFSNHNQIEISYGPDRVPLRNHSPFSIARSVSLHGSSDAIAFQSVQGGVCTRDIATEMSPRRSDGRLRLMDIRRALEEDTEGGGGGGGGLEVDEKVTVRRWGVEKGRRSMEEGGSVIPKIEAKINAWENLQKAKAETEMVKLEMKLEKKRSSSMEKIIKRLKSAQKRAHQMRTSLSSRQKTHTPKIPQITSFSGCFVCHAF